VFHEQKNFVFGCNPFLRDSGLWHTKGTKGACGDKGTEKGMLGRWRISGNGLLL